MDNHQTAVAAAVNKVLTGAPTTPPQDPPPAKAPEALPVWLDPDTVLRLARLWHAVRICQAYRQANDPTVIGQELLARRAVIAEFSERVEREGWDAVVNPPAPAPKPDTFTDMAFAAWWSALARRGLTDGDALLLALSIWTRLPRPDSGDYATSFLEEITTVEPQQDLPADITELRALLAQPSPNRGRGRPKGRHKNAAAVDQAAARELFAKRQAEGRLTIPPCDPWHVLQDPAAVVDEIIATDYGVTNSSDFRALPGSRTRKVQAWLGSNARDLPPLRRYVVIEALAWHCLTWWLDERDREIAEASN
jgi:hypothetical protein